MKESRLAMTPPRWYMLFWGVVALCYPWYVGIVFRILLVFLP